MQAATGQRPKHTPTPEQEACRLAAKDHPGSIMVNAYAGCSKTTTLELMGKEIKVPALGLAFNKTTAMELTPRFAGNWKIQTMNSLGFGAWMRANPQVGKFQSPDGRKLGKLVTQIAKDRDMDLTSDHWDFAHRLVTQAMLAGIVPGDEGQPLVADSAVVWNQLADLLLMDEEDFGYLYELCREVLKESIKLARAGITSFDDQIYCSALLGGKFPQYPFVAVDEAQDLSSLNHRMLQLALRADGRLTVVGDPKQAIYGFRGAHADSMEEIAGLRPSSSWKRLPLATTFRCPKAIVARQQRHAPGFRAWEGCAEGRVLRFPELPAFQGEGGDADGAMDAVQRPLHALTPAVASWGWGDIIDALPHPTASAAILCRNNGPLLSLAFKLLREGVGVMMLGRDIGKGLVVLSRKISPEGGTPTDVVAGQITEWLETETSKAMVNDAQEKIAGLNDRAECLRAVLQSAGVSDASGLRRALEVLFDRTSGLVTLSSIHRAKGREWDLVGHLDPWRLPSKYARQAADAGDRRQLQQEWNLQYVAETRTKHTLVELNLEDFQ